MKEEEKRNNPAPHWELLVRGRLHSGYFFPIFIKTLTTPCVQCTRSTAHTFHFNPSVASQKLQYLKIKYLQSRLEFFRSVYVSTTFPTVSDK